MAVGTIALLVVLLTASRMRDAREDATRRSALDRRRRTLSRHLEMLQDSYELTDTVTGVDGTAAIGLSTRDRSFVVVDGAWTGPNGQELDSPVVSAYNLAAADLLGAEVVQHCWVRTDGPRGAASPAVRSVDLKVFTRDLDHPVHVIAFLAGDTEAGGDAHVDAVRAAWHWEGRIRVLVDGAGVAREAAQPADPAPAPVRRPQPQPQPTVSGDRELAAIDAALAAGQLSAADAKREKARVLADRILARGRQVAGVNREPTA
ncbi:MAG: hypothetical protein H6733_16010 [Alphaproteobacteria bacterium]|nr:hypothetical protein [Alphaproteobacteria bacterium]